MWRTKKSRVEAVEYYYTKNAEEQFEWESVLYPSLSVCCTKFNVSLKAVRNRAWRKNCSAQEAFRHCLKRKKSLETDVFYYRGDEYKNLKECCEKYNINVQSVHSSGIKTAIMMRRLIILERLRNSGNLFGRMEVYMNQSIPFVE